MNITPPEIVLALDKYIIGQDEAKRSLAIALRNRWRRQQVPSVMREEILPNNIILIGPTGVGKTELARRLARLAGAPFLKVEASKFTEVGYVGRDVESIVRDVLDLSVNMIREEKTQRVQKKAGQLARSRILDLLLGGRANRGEMARTREKLGRQLDAGDLDQRSIEIEVESEPTQLMQVISPLGVEEMGLNLNEILGPMMPKKSVKRRLSVAEALRLLQQEEVAKLIDMDEVIREAIARVEETGIVFIDEIDKIAGEHDGVADVSREGVQRDLLPIIEGTTVPTKYGLVRTDHILFISAGAFHVCKPSDLIPELQGRFPIRVELSNLTREDFKRILVEPKNALIKQYIALMKTEGVELKFTRGAVSEIARIASLVNEHAEDIGARRLHTVMTTLLEDILYDVPSRKVETVRIEKKTVMEKLTHIIEDEDLSRYIL